MLLNLVGVNFRSKEEKEILANLVEGDEVFLIRDPHNAYDSNAIKVIDEDNNHLGFIAAQEAKELAPLMDEVLAEDEEENEPFAALIYTKTSALSAIIEFNLDD